MSSCNLCHVHGVIITDISYNSQNLSILSITITIIKESPWMMTIRPVESGGSTVDGINVWDLGPIGVEALRYPELESPSSESILFGALEEDPRRLGTCFEWSVAKSYFNGMELQRRTWKGLIHIPWSVANPKMRPLRGSSAWKGLVHTLISCQQLLFGRQKRWPPPQTIRAPEGSKAAHIFPEKAHTSYLSFSLHRQDCQIQNFTPKNT